MKKVLTLIGLVISSFLLCGCKNDSMEGITIYTSVYPIEYITNELYGEHAKIYNMYPQGIEPYDYKFTNKQISDFASSDLVIYNGLDKEKDTIVSMLNKNRNLKIIDATYKIDIQNNMDEIWINPSNALMIAKNIRDGLKEYITSDLIKNNIDNNYENLKLNLSSLDAELKGMAENAEDKSIVVSNNQFKFLEKYGLNVISLDSKTYIEKDYNEASRLIKDKKIKYIFMKKNEKENDVIKRLKEENDDIEIKYIDTLNNITTSDKNDGLTYYSIMLNNIDILKEELY